MRECKIKCKAHFFHNKFSENTTSTSRYWRKPTSGPRRKFDEERYKITTICCWHKMLYRFQSKSSPPPLLLLVRPFWPSKIWILIHGSLYPDQRLFGVNTGGEYLTRRKIRVIESNAKCRYLINL
jgi:hypothetical protein